MTNSNINLPELRTLFYKYVENPFSQNLLPNFLQTGHGNDLDEEKIIRQFRPVIEARVKQAINSWCQAYRQKLGDFLVILEEHAKTVEESAHDTATAGTVWRDIESTFKAIDAWTGSALPEISSYNPWTDIESEFAENLKTLPDFAHVLVPADCWRVKPEDSTRIRVWKKRKQFQIDFRNHALATRNQLRRLVNRSPVKPGPLQRRFHLHSFLIFYLELPTADFLLTEWQYFLQQIANLFYELHLRTIEIKNDFLWLDDFETAVLKLDTLELGAKLEKLQNHIQSIAFHYQQLDQFESDSTQRFQVFEAEIYEKMWQEWHLAGTYRLSDTDFSHKQIAKGWQRVETRLAETGTTWTRHFQGEQGEWHTDIELALLQLRTAQICYHLLFRVERKINAQVIPVFTGTQESLITLLEDFQELDTDDSASLRDAVAKRNRVILQFLKQDRLPLLIDTLITVQLDNVVNSWGAGIRNAIESLSDEHIIFRDRDLNNPIPNSKIEHIPNLKKVALEDLSSKYETKYHTFTLEIQQSLEYIFRGISEIDRTVDLNLKATMTPLTQRRGTKVAEEARHRIIEGLDSTSLQLGQLITQAEELLALCHNHILQITIDLENQLQVLGNTERIAEVYLRLPSVATGEKFRIRCRKFFTTFRTGPLTLFKIATGIMLQFRSNYFRLREMTGLAPEKADAEKNLSQFLTDTERHISSLPYVYQRLFRLEPLSDEQLFTARAAEIELLKEEFSRWQYEKFTATALIGERGCGITTLLNFAEKYIYKDYPTIKLDFLDGETIFTEADLFNFLKAAFKKTDLKLNAKNMDELEKKISVLEERQVFIVENLHQLFLRTTYGFDALERFMLFISRTHQKIHWVMTCAIYSWQYLAKVINIDEYVQQKIVLNTLSQTALEEIILRRHRASNCQLLFKASDEIADSRRFRKLSSDQARQAFLQNHFFEQLTDLAAGNITVALLLWLRSYEEFTADKLIMPASIDFDPTFLYKLSPKELFTLIAVLQHDILNADHHALVFHQDIQQSLLLLNRMANKGFLVQKSNGYQIHPFLYRSVVRVLKSSNIIH